MIVILRKTVDVTEVNVMYLPVTSGPTPPFPVFAGSSSSKVHSQCGYSESSFAKTVCFSFVYPNPFSSCPPGTKLVRTLRAESAGGFEGAVDEDDVEGNSGVLRGCEIPGVDDEIAEGVLESEDGEAPGCRDEGPAPACRAALVASPLEKGIGR